MPEDIGIMTDVATALLEENVRRALGATKYVFSSYDNDLQFDASGKIRMFTGKEKLVQSALKILLTDLGTAAEDQVYGTTLAAYLGGKMTQDAYTDLVDTVQQAIIHYNDLNSENENSDEYVDTIDQITVSASETDPRILVLVVKMTNEAGNPVDISVPMITE